MKVQCKIELFQFEIYSITIKEGKMSITLAEVAQFQHLLKIGLQLNGIFVSSYILYLILIEASCNTCILVAGFAYFCQFSQIECRTFFSKYYVSMLYIVVLIHLTPFHQMQDKIQFGSAKRGDENWI